MSHTHQTICIFSMLSALKVEKPSFQLHPFEKSYCSMDTISHEWFIWGPPWFSVMTGGSHELWKLPNGVSHELREPPMIHGSVPWFTGGSHESWEFLGGSHESESFPWIPGDLPLLCKKDRCQMDFPRRTSGNACTLVLILEYIKNACALCFWLGWWWTCHPRWDFGWSQNSFQHVTIDWMNFPFLFKP